MTSQPPAKSTLFILILQEVWQSVIHVLAGTRQILGWVCFSVGFGVLFLFFFNQIDVNIILLRSLLHCILVKCFTSVPAFLESSLICMLFV